ncbi:kunitz-type protease inhibitor 2-like [Brachionichthys hirsutus]|uniref:kunitz-type protease inhibitor 2-like n=1 Tax=Brachionichthys hirsutus TaxID=412623 RepID=UPI00360444E0
MTRSRCGVLTVWLLVCSGMATGCEWARSADPGPGPGPAGLEECKARCCVTPGCDMIVFGPPVDAAPQCELVSDCGLRNRNRERCDRASSPQVTVLRRKAQDTGQDSSGTRSKDCEAAADAGPCRAMFPRWFYDRDRRSCRKFVYGGCRGNGNNYDTEEGCVAACTGSLPSDSKEVVADGVSEEYKGMCMVTPDPGPCRAAFTMFYYDSNTGDCLSFIYGGCRGNKNRYTSLEECRSTCTAEGREKSHGEVQNHWSPAVFLFVTLAAVSGLLLVTLLIVSLRRRAPFLRHSSASDKEELLPGPDEKSSLDSLILPESPNPGKA